MKQRIHRTSNECIQVKIKRSIYYLSRSFSLFSKTAAIPFNRRMVKKESFSLLLKIYMYVSRDRRRQDGDGRTDEEKNVHVWRVVLSYDSYLLTTEKTFLLFRRVSLVLSLFLSFLLVCLCVCPLLFSPARERERVSNACLLARARVCCFSLPVCLSPTRY